MNLLFLTMSSGLEDIETSGIYTDLMRKFLDEGHDVFTVYPRERRSGLRTELVQKGRLHSLGVKTLNVTKSNILEKGIGQVLIEYQFKKAFKRYFAGVDFDLILYSTPPITMTKVIKYVKSCNSSALTYLLLKDIFPQNALDLGLLSKKGVKSLLYNYFKIKEKQLYALSDYIGCMSPANVKYLLANNPFIPCNKVEVAPNSYYIPQNFKIKDFDKSYIRNKYRIPIDRPVFIYGGNMGKPQGIPFLIECMKAVKDRTDCHFVLVGNGTEYSKLDNWIKSEQPTSVSLFQRLSKEDYDTLTNACDVGLIFLDYRFTIPNYPSRLLPYLMMKKPIIAVTDPICDTGIIAENNNYGFWSPSNSVFTFVKVVDKMLDSNIEQMGNNGYKFFLDNYTVDHTYNAIIQHLK